MTKIKAVIFDVGGVLHYNSADLVFNDMAQEMGLTRQEFSNYCEGPFDLFGRGLIDETEFWRQFVKVAGIKKDAPTYSLWSRKFENVKDLKVLKIVEDLKNKGIKVAVCSNTIVPHAAVNRENGTYDLFPVVVLSNEVGFRKPDSKIFEITLYKLEITPDEAVFVDDGEDNIIAAEKMGMKGVLFKNAEQLRVDLIKLNIYS
ncbi:hypothetical protein A2872_00565 [Candidatus Gottesmanbacteria bacterium RIFCSPHIGHO2_01_FULL_42_12]|uniref:HAD family hydrolase n=1 Tax=Candidatus Gottesmanbacteria bacterium RIFCSPHIGHO2_01_FULL_42_12 TaxID=1798377 RepID=A0A1F5Z424_9BACT|nr:MAG: hypothetical protein A2872_00565 [Candidatus Gottesmanbacteria bacterium RIFCSPHIGHO2_01_FULL_42_12]